MFNESFLSIMCDGEKQAREMEINQAEYISNPFLNANATLEETWKETEREKSESRESCRNRRAL